MLTKMKTCQKIEKIEKIMSEKEQKVQQFQKIQKEFQTAVTNRTLLESQLKENMEVKQEFDQNPETVYKLIGPVLVKQELAEAKTNVAKRIDYIKAEMYGN
jgi:prefoldin beta subunit